MSVFDGGENWNCGTLQLIERPSSLPLFSQGSLRLPASITRMELMTTVPRRMPTTSSPQSSTSSRMTTELPPTPSLTRTTETTWPSRQTTMDPSYLPLGRPSRLPSPSTLPRDPSRKPLTLLPSSSESQLGAGDTTLMLNKLKSTQTKLQTLDLEDG